MFNRFLANEGGATAIEYVLIAGVMGLMLIVTMPLFKAPISSSFSNLASHIIAGS